MPLRRRRQRFGSARSNPQIAVATRGDHHEHEHRDDPLPPRGQAAVPGVVVQLEEPDPVGAVDQGDRHHGRLPSRHGHLTAGEGPARDRAGDGVRGTDRTGYVHLLQASQGVVGDEHSPHLRPQDLAHGVHQRRRLTGHEPCGCIQQPTNTSFGVYPAGARRFAHAGSRPSSRGRPYLRR